MKNDRWKSPDLTELAATFSVTAQILSFIYQYFWNGRRDLLSNRSRQVSFWRNGFRPVPFDPTHKPDWTLIGNNGENLDGEHAPSIWLDRMSSHIFSIRTDLPCCLSAFQESTSWIFHRTFQISTCRRYEGQKNLSFFNGQFSLVIWLLQTFSPCGS